MKKKLVSTFVSMVARCEKMAGNECSKQNSKVEVQAIRLLVFTSIADKIAYIERFCLVRSLHVNTVVCPMQTN